MDKQSFLDDLFRRMDLSRKRVPANFKYESSAHNTINQFIEKKDNNHKNALFVSSQPFNQVQRTKNNRYALTIQNHEIQFRKQDKSSKNGYRKSVSVPNKSKNTNFLKVQPYKRQDPFQRLLPGLQKIKYQSHQIQQTPDLIGQYISNARSKERAQNKLITKKQKIISISDLIPIHPKELKSSPIVPKALMSNKQATPKLQSQQQDENTLIKSQNLQKIQQKKSKTIDHLNGNNNKNTSSGGQSKILYKRNQDFFKKIKQQQQKQRKQKLLQRKQLHLEYMKPFNPPTNISAYSYIIYETDAIFSKNATMLPQKKSIDSPIKLNLLKNQIYKQQSNSKVQKSKYPNSQKIVISQNSRSPVQVASLTKIMTCILALQLCQKFKIASHQQRIVIGKFQSNIGGTSAQISEGEIYTLQDLYYGLMLPSGNDASVAIACWGGRLLLKYEQSLIQQSKTIHKKKACYNRYISQMNVLAKRIGLQKTTYANSHGLVNFQNKSCAFDLAVLCQYAMSNDKFRKIVSTRKYQNTILCLPATNFPQKLNINTLTAEYLDKKASKNLNQKQIDIDDQIQEGQAKDLDSNEDDDDQNNKISIDFIQKKVGWQNTHRLIHTNPKEYLGIKTGITTAAGPCLASCLRTSENRVFIIIVLNCDKLSGRFRDTEGLKRWLYKKQGLLSPKKKQIDNQNCVKSFSERLEQCHSPISNCFQQQIDQ